MIGLLTAPVILSFAYFGKAKMGFTAAIVLVAAMVAIRLRWDLRKHAWFWGTIVLILALQIPFLFIVQWPQTNIPTIAFAMPIGIADYLLVSGAISLAEKLFSKGDSSEEEAE